MFHTEFVGMFMAYHNTKFLVSIPKVSLVISIKQKAK
jgi:hypothetical protein